MIIYADFIRYDGDNEDDYGKRIFENLLFFKCLSTLPSMQQQQHLSSI